MMPEERCPYCGSEEFTCEHNRIDLDNDKLVNSDILQCSECGGKVLVETDYIPTIRCYYDYFDGTLAKKEVSSNE